MNDQNPAPTREVNKFKELARVVVEHHFGSRPKRIEHKAAGLSNFVFQAQRGSEKWIIRLSPDPAAINSFIKEQWSQKAADAAGVPTAEILEVGNSVVPHPYMITRNVAGDAANVHPKRLQIVRELGEIAARINSIRTKGFGSTFDWSNNLLSLNDSWADYLENEYRYKDKIANLEDRGMIQPAQARQLKQIFRGAAKLRPKPMLCHGDLRLKNVIVDDRGKIAAVLDWEKSTSNMAPHWELSLALHDLGIDEKEAFIDGYGTKGKKFLNALPLIKGFNFLNYVPEVDRAFDQKDKAAIDRVKHRMSGAFDLFSL